KSVAVYRFNDKDHQLQLAWRVDASVPLAGLAVFDASTSDQLIAISAVEKPDDELICPSHQAAQFVINTVIAVLDPVTGESAWLHDRAFGPATIDRSSNRLWYFSRGLTMGGLAPVAMNNLYRNQ